MVDGGALPYDRNVAVTAEATALLHERGLAVEAELGYVGGKDTQVTNAHAPGVRTDPRQAAEFTHATGVDALAVAVGSSHAMTTRTAELDVDLIAALRDAVPVPLVLHGSSGVPDDALRAAVRAGIVKVNIGTALNIAYTGAVRTALTADGDTDRRRPAPGVALGAGRDRRHRRAPARRRQRLTTLSREQTQKPLKPGVSGAFASAHAKGAQQLDL